jgi:Rod binding domain-containing protein
MSTTAIQHAPKFGPADVPKSWGKVNTAANRFEEPDFGSKNEVKEKFTQFVGETFFGQMIKSMRSTVGKPAYFHGGRAEEAFQGMMDQKLSEQLTEATADKFADPMYRRQFPQLAAAEAEAANSNTANALNQLQNLSRR